MTTATRARRTAGLSAEQRRARQDELLAALADGVLELTTSQGGAGTCGRWPPCAPIRPAIAIYSNPVNCSCTLQIVDAVTRTRFVEPVGVHGGR